jgi:hypothetical protein
LGWADVRLDPASAALYALIAICLVAVGAVLTGSLDQFTLAERGTVMTAIVGVLGVIAWRGTKRGTGGGE